MAVNLNKLTALGVARLGKSGYYGDGGGLWLQVSNTGSKSWIFRFRFDGKRHEMGLGELTSVGLADAIPESRCPGRRVVRRYLGCGRIILVGSFVSRQGLLEPIQRRFEPLPKCNCSARTCCPGGPGGSGGLQACTDGQ